VAFGTRFRQRQLADEFIATGKRQIEQRVMAEASQMHAQMSDRSNCDAVDGSACIYWRRR
jgi:hypothetical protein